MKNVLLGTIVLSLFALSFALVQVSCSKSKAQTPTSSLTQLNKIVFVKRNATTSNPPEIWIANYDGTGVQQIPVSLPGGASISSELYSMSVKLSPDGQQVIFGAIEAAGNVYSIYSCNIDGSNVRRIYQGSANEYVRLGGAY